MSRPRFLRVRLDHVDCGRLRRRDDLRILLPLRSDDDPSPQFARLIASGMYEEVPDANTVLSEQPR